jgi:hypothetical protein
MKIKHLKILPLIIVLAVFSCKKEDDDTVANFGTAELKTSIKDSVVCDTVKLDMKFGDERGVDTVMYYIDGKLTSTVTKTPFIYPWNTNGVTDGLHSVRIEVVANDRSRQTINNTVDVYNNLLHLTVDPQYLSTNYSGSKVYILISDYKGNTPIYREITNVTDTIVKNIKGFKEKEFMVSLLAVSSESFRGYTVKTTPGDYKLKSETYPYGNTMEFALNINNVSNCSYISFETPKSGSYAGSLTSTTALSKTSFTYNATSFIPGAVYVLYKNISNNKFYAKLASDIPQSTTTYAMDMADTKEVPAKNIDVSALSYTKIAYVSTYGQVENYGILLWRISSGLAQGVASVPIYYPENTFAKTTFNIQTDYNNGNYDLYSFQFVPSKVDALTNTYQVDVNSSGKFKATTTGNYDYVEVQWNSTKGYWYSYEPNGSINAIIPSIPNKLLDLYPVLGTSSSVYRLTLNNYGGKNTYKNFVDSYLKRTESLNTYDYWHRRFFSLGSN